MNMLRTAVLSILGLALWGTESSAQATRVWFRGTERAALASATGQAAGYIGLPAAADPANLAAGSVAAVPGGNTDRNFGAGVPNQVVTFLHPYTNKAITIPLTLPMGKPRIVTHRSKIVYDYGLFRQKVIVNFHPEGLVEVVYR
jgi:hypothetical protein